MRGGRRRSRAGCGQVEDAIAQVGVGQVSIHRCNRANAARSASVPNLAGGRQRATTSMRRKNSPGPTSLCWADLDGRAPGRR